MIVPWAKHDLWGAAFAHTLALSLVGERESEKPLCQKALGRD